MGFRVRRYPLIPAKAENRAPFDEVSRNPVPAFAGTREIRETLSKSAPPPPESPGSRRAETLARSNTDPVGIEADGDVEFVAGGDRRPVARRRDEGDQARGHVDGEISITSACLHLRRRATRTVPATGFRIVRVQGRCADP